MIYFLSGFDFIILGLATASILILGVVVVWNNRSSATNRAFFIFALITALWGISNYFNYQFRSPQEYYIWVVRLHLFLAAIHALSFLHLTLVIPQTKITYPTWFKTVSFAVIASAFINLSPLSITNVHIISLDPFSAETTRGPGMALFVIAAFGSIGMGLWLLYKKMETFSFVNYRQYQLILTGAGLTFFSILSINLILPAVFNKVNLIPFGVLGVLPFIIFTAYAIIKYRFLNIRVIATELFIFALWLTLILRAALADTITDQIIDSVILAGTVLLGIFLIRSVVQEVKNREKMSQMALDLEITNQELKRLDEAKSDFISIASHQLRTPLSIIKGYISMIREGTYGKVEKSLEDPLHKVYVSNERLINLVSDLLDLSRMERGKMQYEFQPINFGDVVEGIVTDFELVARNKGLKFYWLKNKINDQVKGDANKLRQIVLNLIDNAIKYTKEGSVKVFLEQSAGSVRLSVTDTGPGLTPEEVRALFQKFSRGREQKNEHTEGLGLGLYVARLIAQAHGGDLSVSSPGKGKGSTFALTLPVYNATRENFREFARAI